jgi:hypothetical protein
VKAEQKVLLTFLVHARAAFAAGQMPSLRQAWGLAVNARCSSRFSCVFCLQVPPEDSQPEQASF